MHMTAPEFSFVVPILNERDTLPELCRRLTAIMDGDLQDPPEVALELVARWQEGYEVVYAVRERRSGESWLKRKTATAFYRVMSRLGEISIPQETGDFRLVDRQAVDAVTAMRE